MVGSVVHTVEQVEAFVAPMATRLPFRYGIAEMTAAPHVLVRVALRDGRRSVTGWASEHLPPKWFVKDPGATFGDEVAELTRGILHACEAATGRSGRTPFALALALDDDQREWAATQGLAGLPAGLGHALVERALIDAACRSAELPFVDALERGALGFDPTAVHPELAGVPRPAVGRAPTIGLRHTVGLGDPLTDAEVVDDPRDGLPVSLESALRRHGLRWFKIKTSGDSAADIARIARVVALSRDHGREPRFTIDGNESMRSGEQLLDWLSALLGARELDGLASQLQVVEQPVHRDVALEPGMAHALAQVSVPVVVDESDGDREAVRRAMDLGYAGGTYKGCKGVFRGLANAALVAARGRGAVLTAEDLCTVPPLTVGQDLVVCAAMGLTHVERNGHHYFGTLAPFGVADEALVHHPDLYAVDGGQVRMRVRDGMLQTGSLLRAPFGFVPTPSTAEMAPLSVATAVALT